MSVFRIHLGFILTCMILTAPPVPAKNRIAAVKGKRYTLHPAHGPWMIMVASLRDVDPQFRNEEGLSSREAADELVYSLRRRGIPAYTFLRESAFGQIASEARHGSTDGRYIARHESIAVLAGNFSSATHRKAKAVLDYIQKKFDPKFISEERSGAVFRKTPGRPTPFSRAFIVPNPLRSENEMGSGKLDPLIKKLNSGIDESLLKNKGKYSLLIATFTGNSVMQTAYQEDERHTKLFEEKFGSNLDDLAQQAWELTAALRQARRLGYDRDYDAWVYHDKYNSYVTVGSFDSKDDPMIARLKRKFQAKMKPHPKTGRQQLTPELFSLPRVPKNTALPEKLWFFEMKPRLIAVPGK